MWEQLTCTSRMEGGRCFVDGIIFLGPLSVPLFCGWDPQFTKYRSHLELWPHSGARRQSSYPSDVPLDCFLASHMLAHAGLPGDTGCSFRLANRISHEVNMWNITADVTWNDDVAACRCFAVVFLSLGLERLQHMHVNGSRLYKSDLIPLWHKNQSVCFELKPSHVFLENLSDLLEILRRPTLLSWVATSLFYFGSFNVHFCTDMMLLWDIIVMLWRFPCTEMMRS